MDKPDPVCALVVVVVVVVPVPVVVLVPVVPVPVVVPDVLPVPPCDWILVAEVRSISEPRPKTTPTN